MFETVTVPVDCGGGVKDGARPVTADRNQQFRRVRQTRLGLARYAMHRVKDLDALVLARVSLCNRLSNGCGVAEPEPPAGIDTTKMQRASNRQGLIRVPCTGGTRRLHRTQRPRQTPLTLPLPDGVHAGPSAATRAWRSPGYTLLHPPTSCTHPQVCRCLSLRYK